MLTIPGIIASANYPRVTGSFESIATATGTGSSGTITFSSIPSTYVALQIRLLARSSSDPFIAIRLNGDTAGNYTYHGLVGDGAAVTAPSATAQTSSRSVVITASTYSGAGIIDIHNYASTTQNKTIRSLSGQDSNGSGSARLYSGLWLSTAAVTSISLINSGNFTTDSTFALYGIKGA